MNSIQTLVDYASQLGLNLQSDNPLKPLNKDAHLAQLISQIDLATLPNPDKKLVALCLKQIDTDLTKKVNSLFRFFRKTEAQNHLVQFQQAVHRFQATVSEELPPQDQEGGNQKMATEAESRIRFFTETAGSLGIKNAAQSGKDLEATKAISLLFHQRAKDHTEYTEWMSKYFKGEHFLIEEEPDNSLINTLKRHKHNLRSSSHYDYGSTDNVKGGTVPLTEQAAAAVGVEPQYEITGPQIKELLFGRVKLETTDNGFTFGKKAAATIPEENTKTFTWLQSEWAPDSDQWTSKDFWKHRVLSFGLYVFRKICKFENPNVGPYGYGHADNNPTVIKAPAPNNLNT